MSRKWTVALALLSTLALGVTVAGAAEPDAAKPAAATSHHAMAGHAKHTTMKVDLNVATKEQLEKLPGVDDATADKIIAARPFKSKADLTKKNILTKAQYAKVANHLMISTPKS